jgi:hypothetical protein
LPSNLEDSKLVWPLLFSNLGRFRIAARVSLSYFSVFPTLLTKSLYFKKRIPSKVFVEGRHRVAVGPRVSLESLTRRLSWAVQQLPPPCRRYLQEDSHGEVLIEEEGVIEADPGGVAVAMDLGGRLLRAMAARKCSQKHGWKCNRKHSQQPL